jgi:hypothetical protein
MSTQYDLLRDLLNGSYEFLAPVHVSAVTRIINTAEENQEDHVLIDQLITDLLQRSSVQSFTTYAAAASPTLADIARAHLVHLESLSANNQM